MKENLRGNREAVHGGNIRELAERSGYRIDNFFDFSASINPLGPPPWLRSVISRETAGIVYYPDRHTLELKTAIALRYGLDPNDVLAGNGSTELIYTLPRAFDEFRKAYIFVPSYADYEDSVLKAGVEPHFLFMNESSGFLPDFNELRKTLAGERHRSFVFLGQPNNPTGTLFNSEDLLEIAAEMPAHLFVIDESFADFIPSYTSLAAEERENIVVLRSCTKFFALPGLRLGWMRGRRDITERTGSLLPTWSVNTFAQAAGVRAMEDQEYTRQTHAFVESERAFLQKELTALEDVVIYPGRANFLFGKIKNPGKTAAVLQDYLIPRGAAVRNCSSFRGLDGTYFRIAVRPRRENERLLVLLKSFFASRQPASVHGIGKGAARKRTPAVMFQGTSSNAGKSLMTAALCRLLFQKGYKAAPFKAQNMALNSYVTAEGLEIGRAQAVQALACRIVPDVRMNPVLLKPLSECISQIIVSGKPIDTADFRTYGEYREMLLDTIHTSYDSLARDFDVIVIEGAGSPGEVNLRDRDIANMEMAAYADAPVILVGDIDRGGVYASLLGTMEIMSEQDRSRVGGFLVNKFRGDGSLLESAHRYLKDRTGREVLGVVPYIRGLDLPEEDSVSFKESASRRSHEAPPGKEDFVTLVCVDFPYISNFTDLDALHREPDVQIILVNNVRELRMLQRVDALILPGSKNVLADLQFLRSSGIADHILDLFRKKNTEIIGLCGGLQMLGKTITDEEHIENSRDRMQGLNLLQVETKLAKRKILTQTDGIHRESGLAVTGYEIHHGRTSGNNSETAFVDAAGGPLGWRSGNGMVWGTYLHGVFDNDDFRRWFVNRLRRRQGMKPVESGVTYDLEPEFQRLAKVFAESADIQKILHLIGLD